MSCSVCCSCSKEGRLWLGLVVFVIGAVILLQRFDLVPLETWDYLWPSILVVSGLKFMLPTKCFSACPSCGKEECSCEAEICEVPMETHKKGGAKKGRPKKR